MKDLLEESQNSWKVIILMVMVYYQERIQSKIEQRKNGIGQSPGKEPNRELLLGSSCGVRVTFVALMFNNIHAVLPTREAH